MENPISPQDFSVQIPPAEKSISNKLLRLVIGILITFLVVLGLVEYTIGGPSRIFADLTGGREANYWELSYAELSTHLSYPDLCNKIYRKAYFTKGGGFSGKRLQVFNFYKKCITNVSIRDGNYGTPNPEVINPLEYMGYKEQDYGDSIIEFVKKNGNTDDFKSRLNKLPDFSNIKDDTALASSFIQCPRYFTPYVAGIQGRTPNDYDLKTRPCCEDLNEDKICDGIQSKNKNITAEKMDLSIIFDGQGFNPTKDNTVPEPRYPNVGYIIKNKPFNLTIKIKNNNSLPIPNQKAYYSLGVYDPNNPSKPTGLKNIPEQDYKPLSEIQPGETVSINFPNIILEDVNGDLISYPSGRSVFILVGAGIGTGEETRGDSSIQKGVVITSLDSKK